MRARNIKPGFFRNDQLAEVAPEARLLFIGLWLMADREGRLEDRVKRIKMEVFPADNYDVDELLATLVASELIQRYEVDNKQIIQVVNFAKHQRPHVNEVASILPKRPDNYTKAASGHNQGTNDFALNPSSLNPESLILNPESLTQAPLATLVASEDEIFGHMSRIRSLYPKAARMGWIAAEKKIRLIVENRISSWQQITAGVERYRDYCQATGREAQNPVGFFSDQDKPWLEPWAVMKPLNGSHAEPVRTWKPTEADCEPEDPRYAQP